MGAHDFVFAGIRGGEIALRSYAGRPVMIVNTASKCGFTPQYADLQTLWQRFRDRGLGLIGVPSSDFMNLELPTEAEIERFVVKVFGIDFPLAAKQRVTGAEAHPFYRWLVERPGPPITPRWNFHKVLLSPEGDVAGTWPCGVSPTADAVTGAIERFLVPAH